jgi:hypothetical protein
MEQVKEKEKGGRGERKEEGIKKETQAHSTLKKNVSARVRMKIREKLSSAKIDVTWRF